MPVNRIDATLVNRKELAPGIRRSEAYKEGKDAYQLNLCLGGDIEPKNPYSIRDGRRTAWFAGWYDERIRDRLGHVFDKYGLSYP